jgi:multiple sugar transport system permease protein
MSGPVRTVFGVLVATIFLFPFYLMVVASFEDRVSLYRTPPYLFPPNLDLSSYQEVLWDQAASIGCSVAVAALVVALSLAIAIPAAYVLGRLKPRYRLPLLLTLLAAQIVPTILLALPFYLVFSNIGLSGSYASLIIADSTLGVPFGTLMLFALFDQVPVELGEAARLDGASDIQIIWHILLPAVRGPLIAIGILVFIYAWADFVFSLTLIGDAPVQPVTIAIYRYIGSHTSEWNKLMASAVLSVLPIIVLIALAHRDIRGESIVGAIKS